MKGTVFAGASSLSKALPGLDLTALRDDRDGVF